MEKNTGFDEYIIEADKHTLIIKQLPTMFYEHSVDSSNNLLFSKSEEFNIFKFYVGDFDDKSQHGFHNILDKLQESKPDDNIELFISSYGGITNELLTLYNTINTHFTNRITSFMNYGYSAGAITFMLGNKRVVYKDSEAMFHFTSITKQTGKSSDFYHWLEHHIKNTSNFYRRILKDHFSKEELNLMIDNGKEYWLNSEDMLKRDIATHIFVDGVLKTKDEYFNEGKSKRKSNAKQKKSGTKTISKRKKENSV